MWSSSHSRSSGNVKGAGERMKILIVDDEAPARSRLRALVDELGVGQVVGEAENGHEALQLVATEAADLILLDVRMPEMDGIEAARHLARLEEPPAIIFTTAYDSHALDAFQANAAAYLLKPIRRDRLSQAIERASRPTKVQLNKLGDELTTSSEARTHVSATLNGNLRLLPVDQIFYFRAEHKYVTARYLEGELVIEDSLASLEEEFASAFLRVHRNALVSRAHSRGIRRGRTGPQAGFFDGVDDEIEISRRLAAKTRKALQSLAGRTRN